MSRISSHLKEESFNFRVPAELKAAFQKATEKADRPAAQVIRDFMRAYVNGQHQPEPEPGYDAWLQHQIQKSIDDKRPNVSHETVMKNARGAMDRVINSKKKSHED